MKKILLILAKDNYPSPEIVVNIVPQGLPYIASSLEAAGYEAYGLNPNYIPFRGDIKEHLKEILTEKIEEIKPDYIGLSGLSADYMFVRDAIESIRKIDASIPLLLGGGIISSDASYIFDALKVDYGVLLEGEITVVNLLDTLEKGGDLSEVHGIVYRKDGESIMNEKQMQSVDLDTLPYPNYDIFNIDRYYELSNQENMYFTGHTRLDPRVIVISGGRSCPFKCTFCYHSTGTAYKNRDVNDVIEEIKYFHAKYNFNIVKFYDELFSVNQNRLIELCDAIIELKKTTNISFDWTCTMRVNQLKIPILEKMKESGCFAIGFGFESASDIVLKSMVKKVKKKDILTAIHMCEEVGIGVQANFIFGDPAETIETQKETVEFFLEHCRDHIVHIGIISPFPGSPIWDYCLEHGVITDRKVYYENIHKGNSKNNLMNMTQIPDEDFFTEIEGILGEDYRHFQSAKVLDVVNEKSCNIDVECPHCKKDVKFKYPHIHFPKDLYGILKRSEPLMHYCPECHKRMLIPIMNINKEFSSLFREYINEVNKVDDSSKVGIIIGNDVRHLETYVETTKLFEYYGLNLSRLDIYSFYALKKEQKDSEMLGKPFQTLDKGSIISTLKYIILPHDQQYKTLELLKGEGVDENEILFLKYNYKIEG